MTHLFDTSAALAMLLAESGGERVAAILDDPVNVVGISALTLFEVDTAVLHRTGSQEVADRMVAELRQGVAEVVPVSESMVDLARQLRHEATARVATVDALIAATAAYRGAILVHRDPHFAALPVGRPMQEMLPGKAELS